MEISIEDDSSDVTNEETPKKLELDHAKLTLVKPEQYKLLEVGRKIYWISQSGKTVGGIIKGINVLGGRPYFVMSYYGKSTFRLYWDTTENIRVKPTFELISLTRVIVEQNTKIKKLNTKIGKLDKKIITMAKLLTQMKK
jgi:hypothetical protein